MDNFYQNHRRYVKSRDIGQLNGEIKTKDELSSCAPIITMNDLGLDTSINNKKLNKDDPANPCGLIAKSYFNGL